jgi:3D (Asp-Asp-Asp) domain-containing protein
MKLLFLTLLLSSCYPVGMASEPKEEKKVVEYEARVTYYWPNNGGQVGTQTSTGAKATSGVTIAVDPKIIPYGSKVTIPKMGKTFIAQDTGGHVRSRKAALRYGENVIVVDVFCANKEEATRNIKNFPMVMKVLVEKK